MMMELNLGLFGLYHRDDAEVIAKCSPRQSATCCCVVSDRSVEPQNADQPQLTGASNCFDLSPSFVERAAGYFGGASSVR